MCRLILRDLLLPATQDGQRRRHLTRLLGGHARWSRMRGLEVDARAVRPGVVDSWHVRNRVLYLILALHAWEWLRGAR